MGFLDESSELLSSLVLTFERASIVGDFNIDVDDHVQNISNSFAGALFYHQV